MPKALKTIAATLGSLVQMRFSNFIFLLQTFSWVENLRMTRSALGRTKGSIKLILPKTYTVPENALCILGPLYLVRKFPQLLKRTSKLFIALILKHVNITTYPPEVCEAITSRYSKRFYIAIVHALGRSLTV